MERKSYADAVKGFSWEDGSPGEPVIKNAFSFPYHSVNTKPEVEKEKKSTKKIKIPKSGKR
jgi:hypothetical protein